MGPPPARAVVAPEPYVVALDVDSTVVTHAYPYMGACVGAVEWLLRLVEEFPQIKIMLCTMRSGGNLLDAISWLAERGVPVWCANKNPSQEKWSASPKPHAHVYVDDRALGVPLRDDGCVDWAAAGPMLIEKVRRDLEKFR